MLLATKTTEAIDRAIEEDGGALFRQLQKEAFGELTDAFSPKEETGFRKHLGASTLGRPCAREIWYSWHWAKKPNHPGRLLRLFNRGHLEEARFVAMLRLIGCRVWTHSATGEQLRVSGHDGHYGGSLDGVVSGLPEEPETPHLVEFKTHGSKSFSSLKSGGVREAKWEHYVQMQLYMHAYSLGKALYLAVDKDTDALHGEIVLYDRQTAERYLHRAKAIIDSPEPPQQLNPNASWYQCRYCTFHPICHSYALPEVNCRTCAHSTPVKEGRWECARENLIPASCEACSDHIPNPSMLAGIEVLEANQAENWIRYKCPDGTIVDTRNK